MTSSTKTTQLVLLSAFLAGQTTLAFSPSSFLNKLNPNAQTTKTSQDMVSSSTLATTDRPIYDPFGLYGENTDERRKGQIQPLESSSLSSSTSKKSFSPVLDPLNLYKDKSQVTKDADMSQSLPFLPRPELLTGELPGDLGFDPLGLASSPEALAFQRRAELKHGRIAMLAAAGWPLSELFQHAWANVPGAHNQLEHSLLNINDRVPSILNGGLGKVPPLFWVGTLAFASVVEIFANYYENLAQEQEGGEGSSNFVWDPLGLYPREKDNQRFVETAETFHGRLAMLAIVGFAMQEFVTKVGVINETPFFFHPPAL